MHTHRLDCACADDLLPYVPFTIATGDVVKVVYITYKQGGSLRSPPACTCVCLHVLLNLVRHMVWNSLCIPCMDSSPTMSR